MSAHKILVRDAETISLSPFSVTDWDNDQPSLPGRTISAFSVTGWENDSSANPNVIGIISTKDEWL